MAMQDGRGKGVWGKGGLDGRHRHSRRKEEQDGRRRYKRHDPESSFSFMNRLLKRSTDRFALTVSSIVEKVSSEWSE